MRLFFRRFPALLGLQLFVLLGAMMAGAESVHATTLIVTNTDDGGAGSLRAAIAAASNGDTIQFDPALNGQSILLTSAELAIDKNITIDGPGADQLAVTRSSGMPAFRIFHVLPSHTVIIEGLTISGGDGNGGGGVAIESSTVAIDRCVVQDCSSGGSDGGGIYLNAAAFEDANLTILNSIVTNNHAYGAGGGIYIQASTTSHALVYVISSVVSNNTVGHVEATFKGGTGGGIWNSGETTITNSIVSGNQSGAVSGPHFPYGDGGGITNSGVMAIDNSTISNNSTGLRGGGIYNSGGLVLIGSSTISGNSATGLHDAEGWGEGAGVSNEGSTTITNSTLSNNNSTRSGGAVSNRGSLTIRHSTLSGNNAFKGGTIANYNGAIVHIGHTVLKVGGISPSISNISGTITSDGYNLSSDNGGGVLTGPGDQINTEPMLGPLQNNGGPTFTHEPLTGSPAIDTGNPSFTPPPSNDQRGPVYVRVFGGRIDIGSLEVQPTPPTPTPSATPTPTSTPTPTASPAPTIQALNLSTRMHVQTGDNVGIGGFILAGSVPRRVLVRAVGPTLAQFGIPNPLPDPVIELHGPPGFVTIINDDCVPGTVPPAFCPPGSLEAVIETTLDPGTYTAVVKGKNNSTGVALVEVYHVSQGVDTKLANISTRALVGTADDIVIAGVLLSGYGQARIVFRGIGPSLTGFGVPNALADPTLELRDANGALLVANNDWQENPDQATELIAAGLAPTNPLESGIAATVPPGPYTALLAGRNNSTGVGVVEIYDRGTPP